MSKTEIDNRVAINMDLLAADSSLGHAIDIRRAFCREAAATLRRLDAENKALREKLEAGPWQPIETAPKDKLILVGRTKRMDMCTAMNHSQDGWVTETPAEWVSIYTPSHWMPLPAAPGDSSAHSPTQQETLCWVFEDELPKSMTQDAYNALYPHSRVDTVRMFPIFGPPAPQAAAKNGGAA